MIVDSEYRPIKGVDDLLVQVQSTFFFVCKYVYTFIETKAIRVEPKPAF